MKLKLEPTAAVMMKWGRSAFSNEIVENFINYLDLTSAEELWGECNSVCDWYGEVIVNRNFFINNLVDELLSQSKEEYLILVLAAGKSPHSLQFTLQNPEKVNHVLEIDLSGMDEKKKLYDEHFPQISGKIKCITADIRSKGLLSLLNDILHEFYAEIPSITILEGISYFLKKEELENIIAGCLTTNKNNIFILDYLLPDTMINPNRIQIPNEIYNIIRKYSNINDINPLTHEDISKIFEKYGGTLQKCDSLTEIEKHRLGINKYFISPSDGWIECAAWKI